MNLFFDEIREQSEVKATIVSKYFAAWTKIMHRRANGNKFGYIDLFCGPGIYDDGFESTPIKILRQCIEQPHLSNQIVTIFNDKNPEYVKQLSEKVNSLEGIERLKYSPKISNMETGQQIVEYFKKTNMIPCVSFLDPWGYKGLTCELIEALIKDWGSDCIFFFNYNRINMGIRNPLVVEHINAIFGEERAEHLRRIVENMTPREREETIINELAERLSNNRKNYVLPFKFVKANGKGTSHYLIFVSKSDVGYQIMKDIMWKCSSEHEDGVGSFSYIPVENPQLQLLFSYSRPLDSLGDELLKYFTGRRLTVREIFEKHSIGTNFVLPNYKEALRRLEAEKRIITIPPAEKRIMRKGVRTMADDVEIIFP